METRIFRNIETDTITIARVVGETIIVDLLVPDGSSRQHQFPFDAFGDTPPLAVDEMIRIWGIGMPIVHWTETF